MYKWGSGLGLMVFIHSLQSPRRTMLIDKIFSSTTLSCNALHAQMFGHKLADMLENTRIVQMYYISFVASMPPGEERLM